MSLWLVPIGIFFEFYLEFLCLLTALFLLFREGYKIKISKNLYFGLFFAIVYSVTLIILNHSPIVKYIQQLILIIPFVLGYGVYFNINRDSLDKIFQNYLKVAFIVAVLGIIQFLIYFATNINIFQFIYHRATTLIAPRFMRITSIIDEPGYLSYLLTPAICYYIFNGVRGNFKKFATLFFCFLLTFSTASFLIFFLILIYKVWLRHKFLVIGFFALIFFTVPLLLSSDIEDKNSSGIDGIVMRIADTYNGVRDMDPHAFEALNASSYATLTNIWVAINADDRVFGTGLGTHESNYNQLYQSDYYLYGLNSKDGYSLFIRIFSEFGIIGCFIMLIFFLRNINTHNILNLCAFFILISFLLKGGHYVRYGLIFWFFLFFCTRHLKNEDTKNLKLQPEV